jgi:hypothetical protein
MKAEPDVVVKFAQTSGGGSEIQVEGDLPNRSCPKHRPD